MESLDNASIYAKLFGGIFLTLEECPGNVSSSPYYTQATKMLDEFMEKDLDPYVLHTNLVNWINSEVLDHLVKDDSFFGICAKGYIELARWYLEKYPQHFSALVLIVDVSVKRGQLEIVKLLVEHEKRLALYCCNPACDFGHLEILQWLESEFPGLGKYRADKMFMLACKGGRLEVAKWLIKKYPQIDVHHGFELPFRSTCENGHLNVAKWLKETFPDIDIHARNNCALRWAVENERDEVVRWLTEQN